MLLFVLKFMQTTNRLRYWSYCMSGTHPSAQPPGFLFKQGCTVRYIVNRTCLRTSINTRHSSQLERMGKNTAIPESRKASMLRTSIDPKGLLESTTGALRTKDPDEHCREGNSLTLLWSMNSMLGRIVFYAIPLLPYAIVEMITIGLVYM